MPTLKKHVIDRSVLELARERISKTFDLYDHVAVSFSGGKDSTVCLNLALEEARTRGKQPLDVIFWDEEAIAPETHDYMERVRQCPDVQLRWLCLPVTHVNACSRKSPWWYPWDPDCPHLWTRELPPYGITQLARFNRDKIPLANHLLFPADRTTGLIVGIRADESLNRYRAVAKRASDNYISPDPIVKYISKVKPIYDWSTEDVWTAPGQFGWDFNGAYDTMAKAGISLKDQRVAPPYGEQPMRGLWVWGVCWPHLWHKMVERVPGAATAARYSTTELYAFGGVDKPENMTWEESVEWAIGKHEHPKARAHIASYVMELIAIHKKKTTRPIPSEEPDLKSGVSWKMLYKIAVRGDLKKRAPQVMRQYLDKRKLEQKQREGNLSERDTRY